MIAEGTSNWAFLSTLGHSGFRVVLGTLSVTQGALGDTFGCSHGHFGCSLGHISSLCDFSDTCFSHKPFQDKSYEAMAAMAMPCAMSYEL